MYIDVPLGHHRITLHLIDFLLGEFYFFGDFGCITLMDPGQTGDVCL